jgi:hypothetical protein
LHPTRITNPVDTLLALALPFRTAFVVARDRIERGKFDADPPPGLRRAVDESLPIAT